MLDNKYDKGIRSIDENSENATDDDLSNADETKDNSLMMDNLLERAKNSFLEL